MLKKVILISLFFINFLIIGQEKNQVIGGIYYQKYEKSHQDKIIDFGVKGDVELLKQEKNIHYKYSVSDWHFIRCTPLEIKLLVEKGLISQIYFPPSKPALLNDTMRVVQNIDSIHLGHYPLIDSFTGKNVIMGYVDTGIDFLHGDFLNADGTTRVLRYWDHSLPFDAIRTPTKYGYGQVWSENDINNGICTSTDNHAHGTTVTGTGSGNGKATGTNKGVAPNSNIIIVETNFNLSNWTLTVADAIDYIFCVADTLGMPAVINTSIGDYLGSHDGKDLAGQIIDSLIRDKSGRIVVAAAGNSGNQGKYHVKGLVDSDTNFVWFEVNPSSAFSTPAVYFDLWSDTANFKNIEFAIGADAISPSFNYRGRTNFFSYQTVTGAPTIDSIMNGGNKLAEVQYYIEEINGLYHLEVLIENPDSNNYYFRFMTTGSGEYDLWSGAWMGLSNIVNTGLPNSIDFPDILKYTYPDSLMTTVSSWTCLESVITVGNMANQKTYLDMNGNVFTFPHTVGQLTSTSSKGPTRTNNVKPDVVASGDGILSACPLWLATNLSISNPTMLAQGGLHVRNGGTSMACPVIAGIAALYLEKCALSNYEDFKTDLLNSTYEDGFTGVTPNYAYGNGKVDGFKVLNQTNFDFTIVGNELICDNPEEFSTLEDNFHSYLWHNNQTSSSIVLNETDTLYLSVENEKLCRSISDTLYIIKGTLPMSPVINILGGGLITTPAASHQWFFEGDIITGATIQFHDPQQTGNYSVQVWSPEGCTYTSELYYIDLSTIKELKNNQFVILPNPFIDEFQIIKNDFYNVELVINDISGKQVYNYIQIDSSELFIPIYIPDLPSGMYFLTLKYDNSYKTFKLIRQ